MVLLTIAGTDDATRITTWTIIIEGFSRRFDFKHFADCDPTQVETQNEFIEAALPGFRMGPNNRSKILGQFQVVVSHYKSVA